LEDGDEIKELAQIYLEDPDEIDFGDGGRRREKPLEKMDSSEGLPPNISSHPDLLS